jgi:type IV pilus assembly protein PilE
MKENIKSGFTLIELLVVVLIIGILAAVAVPQYQKTVYKSQAAEVLASIRTLKDALEIYYLQTGSYPTSPDQLDVTIPAVKDYDIVIDNSLTNIRANNKKGTTNYLHLRYFPCYANSPYAGKLLCVVQDNDDRSKSVCVSLGGKNIRPYTHMSGGYSAYDLN